MRRPIWGAILCAACSGPPAAPADAGPSDVGVPPASAVPVADGLAISEVAFFETVKVSVTKDGAAVTPYNAPLVTGRKGVARVYTAVKDKKYKVRFVEAELHLVPPSGPEVVVKNGITAGTSTEDDPATTFVLPYDESALAPGTGFYLVLRDPKAATGALRYPDADVQPLELTQNPGRVRARLVPVRYQADMSNRIPDTSAATLSTIRTGLTDLYPTNEIDLDVRAAVVDWPTTVDAGGNGWPDLLQAIVDARAADQPPADMYYVGWFEPRASFGQYCQGGCIVGLATVAAPAAPAERAVLVAGFGGEYSAETVAHELGHVMGRMHAPCGGAQGTDPKFPYPDGSTGVPGWRASDETFQMGDSDIMGYCQPYWISDYTYRALANRIRVVNAGGYGLVQGAPHDVQRILIAPSGALTVGKPLRMTEVIGGDEVTVRYRDAAGRSVASARGARFGYDHLPGGFVLVVDPPRVAFATVTLD